MQLVWTGKSQLKLWGTGEFFRPAPGVPGQLERTVYDRPVRQLRSIRGSDGRLRWQRAIVRHEQRLEATHDGTTVRLEYDRPDEHLRSAPQSRIADIGSANSGQGSSPSSPVITRNPDSQGLNGAHWTPRPIERLTPERSNHSPIVPHGKRDREHADRKPGFSPYAGSWERSLGP